MTNFQGTPNADLFTYWNGAPIPLATADGAPAAPLYLDRSLANLNDTYFGYAGNDAFSPGAGSDLVYGDAGTGLGGDLGDTIDYSVVSPAYGNAFQGVVVNLAAAVATDPWGFTDYLYELENVVGTNLNDVITSNFTQTYIMSLGGNDVVQSLGAPDTLLLGAGNDTGYGNGGNDTIFGEAGADLLFGQGDNDYLYGGTENDNIFGGDGNDNIFGEAGVDNLYGEGGNDNVNGGTQNDVVDGGAGVDTYTGGAGSDTFVFAYGQGTHNPIPGLQDFVADFQGANIGIGGDQDIMYLDTATPGTTTFTNGIAGVPLDVWSLDPDGAGPIAPQFIQIAGVATLIPNVDFVIV
jgi:Ca2+-binding RTX toxin-like protein